MENALVIGGAILMGAGIISIPLSRIAENLSAIAKAFYNPDGTRR